MVARTISPLISRSISRAINELEGAAFNPLSLFAAGEQGVWYDPSDMSTLFQDAAGTIPVTAAGQPVGMMRDKSGRGNHATQATATSRPILQTTDGKWYLAFDGVDDFISNPNVPFSSTDKATLFAGVNKLSDVRVGNVFELSANVNSNAGSFAIYAPSSNGTNTYMAVSRGTSTAAINRTDFTAPHKAVLAASCNISGPRLSLHVNTTTAAAVTITQGTGGYNDWPLYIGRRAGATIPFNGHIFGIIIRGASSTAEEISNAEGWMNSKTGAY